MYLDVDGTGSEPGPKYRRFIYPSDRRKRSCPSSSSLRHFRSIYPHAHPTSPPKFHVQNVGTFNNHPTDRKTLNFQRTLFPGTYGRTNINVIPLRERSSIKMKLFILVRILCNLSTCRKDLFELQLQIRSICSTKDMAPSTACHLPQRQV